MLNVKLDLNHSYDVIVAGGGPAGCAAAASAAREGAKTLLVESTASLGGMGTSGLVPAWCPFSDQEKVIYKGLAELVFNRTKEAMPFIDKNAVDWVPIDPESLKTVCDDLMVEYGVDVLFNTTLAAVNADGGRVDNIVLCNKNGLTAYRAKVYIDCTGDADLAAWAGAAYQKGGESGALQPGTHCFILSNINEEAYAKLGFFHGANKECVIHDIVKDEKYPLIVDSHMCNNKIGPGTYGFNAGHLFDVDNTDPVSASRAAMLGRRIAAQYRDALKEYAPEAFGDCFLVSTGSLIGIRETRRIVGDYTLTAQDYVDRRTFEDDICRNCYFIDVHHTVNAHKERAHHKTFPHYQPGESHGIPYRCLIPKGLDNCLVAGRSISCEREVQGSVRVMPVCLSMGEAAGMAAAMAASGNCGVRDIDVAALRSGLKRAGAYV